MMEWRDIESAPKDGTHFLAYDPVAKEYDVCRMVEWGKLGWRVDSLQSDGQYGQFEDEFNASRATHWMLLPDPPSLNEEANRIGE